MMALLSSSAATRPIRRHFDRRRLLSSPIHLYRRLILPYPKPNATCSASWRELGALPFLCAPQIRPSLEVAGFSGASPAAFRFCQQEPLALDAASLAVKECESDDELLAAVRLRVRTFYDEFDQSSGDQDQRRHLEEREFEALKDRIDGKRIGFKRVSCINATLPLSPLLGHADGLCSACMFSQNGEDRVVVATLDINQCLKLADELTGKRPEVLGAGLMRAYLSNVCVAKELQRNGLGFAIVSKSKAVARRWGINDLYVHVAVDNEAALKLYGKSGFVYENEEPAWQARFLGRPRRFLLWADLSQIELVV
ncbi:GCN5-related N-acetyltransferase 7, chloroplastic-like isoform X1 [Musa acuminata AAA Group]|uniref:GCN5-related N-acetyltransferase 7, chloroplastic-like isoform X1 n=1 Tax=Musa acuminata AAA Group TaxID=214697 RepID=UPI0031D9F431